MAPKYLFLKEIYVIRCPSNQERGYHKEWMITAEDSEKALAKRHHTNMENLNEHVKELKPLQVGQSVLVQNQDGNHGKRLSRSGTVIETGPGLRQYAVWMDGSRNVNIRNRKFHRTFTGVADMMAYDDPQQHLNVEGGPAVQIIRQEEVDGIQSKTVNLGGGDDSRDNTAEQVPVPAVTQGQDTGGTEDRCW